MSRSFNKNTICGNTAASTERAFKQRCSRRKRRLGKMKLLTDMFGEHIYDVSHVDSEYGPKDGKQYVHSKEFSHLFRK